MSEAEQRSKPAENLKEKILAASSLILIQDGYEGLTMRRLANEIGYSATTIYLYFKNRDAIVAELGRSGLAVLEKYVTGASQVSDAKEALKQFASQYVRFSEEHPGLYRLIFMQGKDLADAMFRSDTGREIDGAGLRVFSLMIRCFAQLQATDPAWSKVNPSKAAESFWTSLHGIISLKLAYGKFLQTAPADLAAFSVSALLAGMPEAFSQTAVSDCASASPSTAQVRAGHRRD